MTEPTGPTVMVVDDHPIWRDAVARDLADDGFNVVATAEGVAAARRRAAVVRLRSDAIQRVRHVLLGDPRQQNAPRKVVIDATFP